MNKQKRPIDDLLNAAPEPRSGDDLLIQPLKIQRKDEGTNGDSSRDHKTSVSAQEALPSAQQVPIHAVQFRQASKEGRYRRLSLWTFLILTAVLSGSGILGYFYLKTSPKGRKYLQEKIGVFKGEHQKVSEYLGLAALEKSLLSWYAPGTKLAGQRPWREMDCRFLIEEALSRKLNKTLDPEGSYLLVSCQIAQDMPQVALRMARDSNGDAAGLKQNLTNWSEARFQLAAAEARYRIHALEVQSSPRYDQCRQWSPKPDCLLRFVDEARQPLLVKQEKAFSVLETGLKQTPADVKVWFYWAAGLSSIKSGLSAEAETRLQKATHILKDTYDPFLERALFKSRVQNAWINRDLALMQKVWKERPKQRMQDDPMAFLDSRLMYKSLASPQEGLTELDGFLQQSESYLRFRYDPLFVRWVVEQSIQSGRAAAARRYLELLTQSAGQELKSSEWLSTLWVRIDLSEHKGVDALKTLQVLERYIKGSALLHHLRGLAMLEAFSSKDFRLRAAQEFQKAVNMEGSRDSYLALIISFIEAGSLKKADATLNFWQKQRLSDADKRWLGLTQALLLRFSGRTVESDRNIISLKALYPDFEPLRKAEQELKANPKAFENQPFKTLQLMLGPYGAFGPLVYLGQKS